MTIKHFVYASAQVSAHGATPSGPHCVVSEGFDSYESAVEFGRAAYARTDAPKVALAALHTRMSVAGVPNRPIDASATPDADDIERAAIAYWTAHGKALDLERGARGTFAALIGEAFTRADKKNAARLISAFPDLFAD